MIEHHALWLVAVISVVTIGLRFLPFLLFGGGKPTPAYISYLGKVLPYAVMGMLVVFCFRDLSLHSVNGWLPQLIAALTVVLLQIWKRKTLLSILGGTGVYMLLIRLFF